MLSPALQLIADRHAHLLRVLDAEDHRLETEEAARIAEASSALVQAQHPDSSDHEVHRKAA